MNIQPSHYDESEIFLCDCSDVSHNITFQFWDFCKDDEKLWYPADQNCQLVVNVFLNDYPSFWRRVWLGTRYIFGYKSKYGHYDTMTVRYEDVPRMKAILDKFTGRVDEYAKRLEDDEIHPTTFEENRIFTQLFVDWWFNHHDDALFFNQTVQQCPTISKVAIKEAKDAS